MAGTARPSSKATQWIFAGLTSEFPNIDNPGSNIRLSEISTAGEATSVPICKVLQTPSDNDTETTLLIPTDASGSVGLREQVLIFQHRGKFHAVDHQCPHRSYPLSRGTLYDIEDFGIKLSVGITCPKHGWAFDVHTGESDRGAYRLRVWDVEIRSAGGKVAGDLRDQIWIRQRIQG